MLCEIVGLFDLRCVFLFHVMSCHVSRHQRMSKRNRFVHFVYNPNRLQEERLRRKLGRPLRQQLDSCPGNDKAYHGIFTPGKYYAGRIWGVGRWRLKPLSPSSVQWRIHLLIFAVSACIRVPDQISSFDYMARCFQQDCIKLRDLRILRILLELGKFIISVYIRLLEPIVSA